jgi:hypothetical protein
MDNLHSLFSSTGVNGYGSHSPELVGELIESTTVDFVAQAAELDAAPPLGAFVEVGTDQGLSVYGVVAHVETAGIDPGARPIMRGHGDVRDGLIYAENPDLPLVLRTTFRSLVVGYGEHGSYHQVLPARPPRLHYSVWVSTAVAVRAFTDSGLDYLNTLLASPEAGTDELIAANVRLTALARGEPQAFARTAGRELAQLLRSDYARLSSILRRISVNA